MVNFLVNLVMYCLGMIMMYNAYPKIVKSQAALSQCEVHHANGDVTIWKGIISNDKRSVVIENKS